MTQHILPGNPPISVVFRHSARARRLSLRVSRLDGQVSLTLPRGVPEPQGMAFVQEKETWLRGQLDRRPARIEVGLGSEIMLEGRPLRILPGPGRSVAVSGGDLLVPGAPERVPARVQGFVKQIARERLVAASDRYAERLGRGYCRITLRDTRSRWGSCSGAGALMYSWRLVMAPAAVLEYVAAHEVAHLAEMNHSPAFWARLEELHGPYSQQRDWLRINGETLHRYRFDD